MDDQEYENLTRDELINQIKALKGKINILTELNEIESRNAKETQDQECQTDEELVYNYAWQKYYYYFQSAQGTSSTSTATVNVDSVKASLSNEPINAKAIKEIAEESLLKSGLVYDYNYGLYYDQNRKLYYDPKNGLYFDYGPGIYYKLEDGELEFHSQIDPKLWAHMKKTRDKEKVNEAEKEQVDKESVIELSSDDEKSDQMDTDQTLDVEELTTQYPPCIRAIVKESSVISPGSLFIIPYTGGSIGRQPDKNILILIEDENVSKVHATFTYDEKEKKYFIKDESTNGTIVNDNQLAPNDICEINHGDTIKIIDTSILLHIHQGLNTCINCEPGEVMSKLSQSSQKTEFLTAKEKEKLRRERNKELKKKYGLEKDKYEKNEHVDKARDRAKERRKEVGSEAPHEIPTQTASVHKPIADSNIGKKLLMKMGWESGKGLGKTQSGIVEPIATEIRVEKAGLGLDNAAHSIDIDENKKKKIVSWTKTKQRFEQLKQKPVHSAFVVDDDEDADMEIQDEKAKQ